MITQEELRKSMEMSLFSGVTEAKSNDELYEESSNDPMFYGLPHTKQYPMPDKKHVRSAIRFFNYVTKEDEEELARNINKQIVHFKMDDINVGDGNRFKKYFKPYNSSATESAVEKQYMFGSQMKKSRELWKAVSSVARNSLRYHCTEKDTLYDFNRIQFAKSWDAHGFDVRRDLADGLLNMTVFKIDINDFVKFWTGDGVNDDVMSKTPKRWKKGESFEVSRKRAIKVLKNLLDKVTADIKATKSLKKIQCQFNVGYHKYGDKTFIYCVEWSFKKEARFLSRKMKAGTKWQYVKDFGKEMKEELKRPVKDEDDKAQSPYAGRNVDLFGSDRDSDGNYFDDDDDDYSAEDSVMTATAPIVPYTSTLNKRWR